MNKQKLINKTNAVLKKFNFEFCNFNTSVFDIFAQKNSQTFIFKVTENIDSFSKENSLELRKICYFSNSAPFLIGDHTSFESLQDFVVYIRHEVPAISVGGLERVLTQQNIILRTRGGYSVKIDKNKFKQMRKKSGLSLNRLSKISGISARSLINYENEGKISLENAAKLENIFGILPVSFEFSGKFSLDFQANSLISKKLLKIGFFPLEFKKTPFDFAAKNKEEDEKYIIKVEKELPNENIIEFMKTLQEKLTSTAFFIFEKNENFDELPCITKKEFKQLKNKEQLREIFS